MLYEQIKDMQILENATDTANCIAISNDDLSTLMAVYISESVGLEGTDEILDEPGDVTESTYSGYDDVMERTIVKLDKRAKKNQAYKVALYAVAREADDPDYKRLVTLWQMEKYITRKLEKKYGVKAKAYMREMKRKGAEKNKESKNPVIKKMTNVFTHSERETQKAKKLSAPPKGLMSKGKNVMGQLNSKVK